MVSLVINATCRTNYTVECCVDLRQEDIAILPGPTRTSRMHACLRSGHRKAAPDEGHSKLQEKAQTKDGAGGRPAEERA
jgi:hypothetical protein